MSRVVVALAVGLGAAAAQSATISVDWSNVLRPLATVAGFQTVVNPVTCRESPYHDQVYQKIADLAAPWQRYVPWLPYPRLGIAELEPPSSGSLCAFVNSGGAGPDAIWSATLDCGAYGAGTIDGVIFANYGKPTGYCNGLKADSTCSKDVSDTVSAACVGKAACTLLSNDATFGAAPCAGSRLAVEVTCSNTNVKVFTYWDFKYPDQGMTDFLKAANASGRTSIPNFSTIPNWLFAGQTDRSYFPDDPLGEVWNYEQGHDLADPTGTAVGDYYGRLVAHYIEPGGFIDEGGRRIPGLGLSFTHWEVLNELEHGLSPQLYTTLYDAIVTGIKRWCPIASKTLKFMGLALGGIDLAYITYFLNKTNHVPGIQIDAISFHHYAGSTRDGGPNASDYESFFPSGDGFVDAIVQTQAARAVSDWPNVLMDADEVGVILDDDNDPKYTSLDPGFPAVYWNAAAAMYAYLFGKTAQIGLEVLGESQLIGYPSIPFQRGAPYNGNWIAPPQYPSVSLLSWGGAFGNPGDGTARYWVLQLLGENTRATGQAGAYAPADADVLVNTTVVNSGSGGPVSSPFCAEVFNLDTMTMYCASPGAAITTTFASYGTPSGSCGSWVANASCNTPNSLAIVQGFCDGKQSCSFPADTPTFGDPCYGTVKHLAIEATCSVGGGAQVKAGAGVYAQAFVESAGTGARKILIVNKGSSASNVTFAGAAGKSWIYIDESTAYGPAATVQLAADTWTLAPYSLGFLRM